jgi:glycosyltransferase involved in cell wall biosynthesis
VRVSIIVPAFNEAKGITATLRSIQTAASVFTARGWDTELIVCDNNSTDHTAALAAAAGARVVFEPINQIGRARNTGAQAACGQWLIFVDADSHPSPELFAEVADAIASGCCLAGGSTVRLDSPHLMACLVAQGWNLISRITRWAPGSFIFCETAAFHTVGGFNPKLYASEEIDLFRRLKRLARQQGRSIRILHRHPLLTSARKAYLYSPAEHLRFLFRTVWRAGRTLQDPAECYTWYDGRR